MGFVLLGIGALFGLAGFVGAVLIIIDAFKKEGAGKGMLCFCCFPYTIYYAFTKFDHPKKSMIIALWLGGSIVGGVFQGIGQTMMMGDLQQQAAPQLTP